LRGLSTGDVRPSGKGKRLIIVHIGLKEGFVPGCLLSFCSKKNTIDYHDEMNGDTFFDWMKTVIPLLKKKSVIIMDIASYHFVQKRAGKKWISKSG